MKPNRILEAMVAGALLCLVPYLVLLLSSEKTHHWGAFRRIPRTPVIMSVGMVITAWLCHIVRVRLMARALGYPCRWNDALRAAMGMELGVAATPGGIGGALLKTTFLHRRGVPVSDSVGMIAADWLFDGVFFVLSGAVGIHTGLSDTLWRGMLQAVQSRHLPESLWQVGLVGVAAILGSLWLKKRLLHVKGQWLCGWPSRVHEWGSRLGTIFRNACEVIPRLAKARFWVVPICLLLAVVQGTCRFGVLPLLVHFLNPQATVLPLFPLQAILWGLSLAVVVPGGGGGVEVLSLFFLQVLMPHEWVSPVVLTWRFLTFHLYWMVGALVVLPALLRRDADPI